MKAGLSKLIPVLGILAIVSFIGFFIKNFEVLMAMMNDPASVSNAFLDDPIGFTMYMIAVLFFGFDGSGA